MSAKAIIVAWLLNNPDEDVFTAGEEIERELIRAGYLTVEKQPKWPGRRTSSTTECAHAICPDESRCRCGCTDQRPITWADAFELEEYPRVHTCVNGWCPKRREECERCDRILEIFKRHATRRDGEKKPNENQDLIIQNYRPE